MNEPRPAMISARPPESWSSVANCSKTRTGSSVESTRDGARERIRLVRVAAPRRARRRGRRPRSPAGGARRRRRRRARPRPPARSPRPARAGAAPGSAPSARSAKLVTPISIPLTLGVRRRSAQAQIGDRPEMAELVGVHASSALPHDAPVLDVDREHVHESAVGSDRAYARTGRSRAPAPARSQAPPRGP